MNENEKYVSIIIPAFNEERYLGDCLKSIFGLNFDLTTVEVILVDNGSTDKTLEIAKSFPVKTLIKKHVKVGGVRNFGAEHATGKYIVFLDSDCVVEPDWLTNGISKLQSDASLILGGQYLMRENPSWLEKYWVLTNSRDQIYQTTLVGGCIFIPRKVFLDLGGFNPLLNSGEDSDLTYRLTAAGYTVKIDPSLSVVHLGYPSELIPFIKRQIWHSSDYITNIKKSIADKIFLLTAIFMFLLLVLVIQMLLKLPFQSLTLVALLLLPISLSYKRISRSKTTLTQPFDLFSIYCVDVLYLVGRLLGTLASLKLAVFNRSGKINR